MIRGYTVNLPILHERESEAETRERERAREAVFIISSSIDRLADYILIYGLEQLNHMQTR